jgi:hypothetical protein
VNVESYTAMRDVIARLNWRPLRCGTADLLAWKFDGNFDGIKISMVQDYVLKLEFTGTRDDRVGMTGICGFRLQLTALA